MIRAFRGGLLLAGVLVLIQAVQAQTMTGGTGTSTGSTGTTTGGTGTTSSGSSGNTTTGGSTPTNTTPNFAPTTQGPAQAVPLNAAKTNTGNPFTTYYSNPLAMGLPTGTSAGIRPNGAGTTIPWGTALYSSLYSNTNSSGLSSNRNTGAGSLGSGMNSGLANNRRSYGYTTSMEGAGISVANVNTQRPQLQQVIGRSASLPSRDSILVDVADGTVVLRGTVKSDRERRLAENLLRLSPGVYDIRNELIVQTP